MATAPTLKFSADTHRIYDVIFDGDHILTTLTHSSDIVDDWIAGIHHIHHYRLHKLLIGLDIEWRPSFTRNITNPTATLQLCVGHRCLIFQLIYADQIPQSLVDFLSDDDFTFVGVGIGGDVKRIEKDYGLEVSNWVDLRDYAADVMEESWFSGVGLKVLAREVIGKEVDKPKTVTLSRWDADWLSLAQVHYACVDAFLPFEIGRHLKAWQHNWSS